MPKEEPSCLLQIARYYRPALKEISSVVAKVIYTDSRV